MAESGLDDYIDSQETGEPMPSVPLLPAPADSTVTNDGIPDNVISLYKSEETPSNVITISQKKTVEGQPELTHNTDVSTDEDSTQAEDPNPETTKKFEDLSEVFAAKARAQKAKEAEEAQAKQANKERLDPASSVRNINSSSDPKVRSKNLSDFYRQMSRRYHPDVSNDPDALRKMQEINDYRQKAQEAIDKGYPVPDFSFSNKYSSTSESKSQNNQSTGNRTKQEKSTDNSSGSGGYSSSNSQRTSSENRSQSNERNSWNSGQRKYGQENSYSGSSQRREEQKYSYSEKHEAGRKAESNTWYENKSERVPLEDLQRFIREREINRMVLNQILEGMNISQAGELSEILRGMYANRTAISTGDLSEIFGSELDLEFLYASMVETPLDFLNRYSFLKAAFELNDLNDFHNYFLELNLLVGAEFTKDLLTNFAVLQFMFSSQSAKRFDASSLIWLNNSSVLMDSLAFLRILGLIGFVEPLYTLRSRFNKADTAQKVA